MPVLIALLAGDVVESRNGFSRRLRSWRSSASRRRSSRVRRAPGIAASADISVELAYEEPGRRATITGLSPDGQRIVARLDTAPATEPVN